MRAAAQAPDPATPANAPDRLGPLDPPPARRVAFDFAGPCPPTWMAGSFAASCLMNAYTLVFPALETVMMRYVAQAAKSTETPTVLASVRGFLQQEGSHAREHRRSYDAVRAQGYDIDALERQISSVAFGTVDRLLRITRRTCGEAFTTGIFAGAEHWTAAMAMMSLNPNSHGYSVGRLEQAHSWPELSDMEALYLWHVTEELEHKCVVADLFSDLGGGEIQRIVSFLFFATPVFFLLTAFAFGSLLRQAPVVLGPREWARTGRWRGLAYRIRYDLRDMPPAFGRAVRSYVRRGYHPSQDDTDALVRRAFERLHAVRAVRPA